MQHTKDVGCAKVVRGVGAKPRHHSTDSATCWSAKLRRPCRRQLLGTYARVRCVEPLRFASLA